MAFRRKDMRELQEKLIPWGVSSLGRLEADVLGTLNAVTNTIGNVKRPREISDCGGRIACRMHHAEQG